MDKRVFKRKTYDRILQWKQESNGESALMIQGARRIGKSTIAEEFAKREYSSYLIIDFNKASATVKSLFDDLMDLDEEDMAELEEGIRATCKMTIRTLEIFYEELEKSNLPDSVKTAILVSKANNN